MRYLQRKRVRVGLFLGALFGVLTAGLFLSPSALAKGEYYQYIPGDDTIRVTGGTAGSAPLLASPAGLQRTGSNTFEGQITVTGLAGRVPNGNNLAGSAPCTYTLTVTVIGDIRQPGDQANGDHRGEADIDWGVRFVGDHGAPGQCRTGDTLGSEDIEDLMDTSIVIHNAPDPRGSGGGNTCPGSNAPAGTDCSTIPAGCPGTTQPNLPPGTPAPTNCPFQQVNTVDEAVEPDPCPIEKTTVIRWMLCPTVEVAHKLAGGLDTFIDSYLQTGNDIFTDSNGSYRRAWETFRTFGLGLVFIVGLIMIASEALGLQLLDAYTIRKMLPRLAIAILGIALSWTLMEYLVKFFDTLGHAAGGIIYSSFNVQPSSINIGEILATNYLGGAAAAAYLFSLGPMGIVSLFCTLALAMLIGAIILILRQAIIVAAVLLAPLAIAAYVLPNTNKFANFWWNTFISMMLLYPIATGIIALCKVLGNITLSLDKPLAGIVGPIFFFAGYALLPAAFRLSGGLVATLGGFANDRGRGGFDRLRNFRAKQQADRFNAAREGRDGFIGARAYGAFARRATTAGNPFTRRGRELYRENVITATQGTVEDILKRDNGRAANDDDANAIAQQVGISRGQFVQQYADRTYQKRLDSLINQQIDQQEIANGTPFTDAERKRLKSSLSGDASLQQQARKQATDNGYNALAALESSYGAQVGSRAVAATAYKARAASVTGYMPDTATEGLEPEARLQKMYAEIYQDAAKAVNSGLVTHADAIAALKSNKARPDISGVGFGAHIGQLEVSAKRYAQGKRGTQLIEQNEAVNLGYGAIDGSPPGALISQRKESVQVLAPLYHKRIEQDYQKLVAAENSTEPDVKVRAAKLEKAQVNYVQRLASTAALLDAAGQVQPQNARILADGLMGQQITNLKGERVTVQKAFDELRTDPSKYGAMFNEIRREYGRSNLEGAINYQQGLQQEQR